VLTMPGRHPRDEALLHADSRQKPTLIPPIPIETPMGRAAGAGAAWLAGWATWRVCRGAGFDAVRFSGSACLRFSAWLPWSELSVAGLAGAAAGAAGADEPGLVMLLSEPANAGMTIKMPSIVSSPPMRTGLVRVIVCFIARTLK
jgi:hypothetical protein